MVRNENRRQRWASKIRQLTSGGAKGNRRRRPLFVETLEDRRLLATVPVGDEFRVNQIVSGSQALGGASDAVGVAALGDFVVTYTGKGAKNSDEIFAQRFAADGARVGGQIRVNQSGAGGQDLAAIGMQDDGQFVVVWAGQGMTDSSGVFFRRFNAEGQPLGADQRVNFTTRDIQSQPAIAVADDGQFAIVWAGRGVGDTNGVFLRRFGADGIPRGGEVRVNKTIAGIQNHPDIAWAADGSLAVSWSGQGKGDLQGIYLQCYAPDGTPVGDETRVNQSTAGSQHRPDVVYDESGSVIVVWSGAGVGDATGVFWRRLTVGGSLLGDELRVNTNRSGIQKHAAIAAVGDGTYFVTWFGEHLIRGKSKGWDILSQQIDLAGQRLVSESVVNVNTQGLQQSPSIGSNGAGQVVVAWSGKGPTDNAGAYARRFVAPIDHDPPQIQAALASDTGLSATDRLTTEPSVQGRVIDASPIASLRAGLEQMPPGSFQEIVSLLQPGGNFTVPHSTLDQLAGGALADGPHTLRLQATDALGNASSLLEVPFVLDTAAPRLTATLTNDTGANDGDGVTSDPTMGGAVQDVSRVTRLEATFGSAASAFVDVSDLLTPSGQFVLTAARLESITGAPLVVGAHLLRLRAIDEHGHASETSVGFTLQPDGLFITDLGLSAASDSLPAGDQKTNAGRVVLVGRTQPLATLTFVETGATSLANSDGRFQFPGVTLNLGQNTFTITAANVAGETAQQSVTIERRNESTAADPVLRWNQAALEAARQDASTPTYASRAFAMVQAAIYDAVAAIDHSPNVLVALSAPSGASLEAAISGAGERVLDYLYPAQAAAFATTRSVALGLVPDGTAKDDGVAFGKAVADAVIAIRSSDGWDDFEPISAGNAPGEWQFTPPMYDPFLTPQWATLQPFAITSPDQFRPPGPPELSSQEFADAYNEVRLLGEASSSTRTAEQTQIARFWADGPGTFTPAGHWNAIASQMAMGAGNSVAENARLFAMLNVALADAAIAAWDAKAAYSFWRPVTAIRAGETDGNDLTAPDADWSPLLITPPFPDYVSGHSTFSGAGAAILAATFGDNTAFSTGSQSLPGVTRTFGSFTAAAAEAGQSRIYAGIHYQFANQDGLATGRALAQHVLGTFSFSTDELSPRIVIERPDSELVTKTNIVAAGGVLDNLSGVQSLEAQLDDGVFAAVSLNASGQFSLPTQFALDGSADGAHAFFLRATDAAGNLSPVVEFAFTLDTAPPTIVVAAPAAGSSIEAGALVSGTADGTGSHLTQLTYTLDGGTAIPLPFSNSGAFSSPLDLSKLAAGQHTLAIQARDSAGNISTVSQTIQLGAPIPLTITAQLPLAGAVDVGTTFKPRIDFSRAINAATLTSTNFYAATPAGDKVPANIVVADDGSFGWLFPLAPMPGGARITLHVDGSTILAAGDGQPLDADGDGAAGGSLAFSFTTVSLTPLTGTTLRGRVLDPGPDLKPMTFDDFRAGPDGALFTGDDLFLLPIAGAKVWIVGLEDQFVLADAQGNFQFDAAPAGNVKLAIDGRTATGAPAGVFFPEMVMDLVLDPGRDNTVMGSMGTPEERESFRERQEVYLPRLESLILQAVSPTQTTTIGVDARSAPNLTPQERSLLTIEIAPGSLLDEHGNPVANGQVGISTVPPELVREMLPPGVLQHTFDITIQAPGITNFSTPAAMTFPNVMNAPPGTQLSFLSFDHTTGRLVIDGTATVSADGLSVTTNPGQGITHPGWHGLPPQGGPGGPQRKPPPLVCAPDQQPLLGLDSNEDSGRSKSLNLAEAPVPEPLFGLRRVSRLPGNAFTDTSDFLFTSTEGEGRLEFFNPQPTSPCFPSDGELLIDVTVKGQSNQFLRGLVSSTFFLLPGKTHGLSFLPKAFSAAELRKLRGDQVFGVEVKIEVHRRNRDGTFTPVANTPEPFFVYRYVEAADDANDGLLRLNDTLNDGPLGITRERQVTYHGDASALPTLEASGEFAAQRVITAPGQPNAFNISFDPTQDRIGISTEIHLMTPGAAPRQVGGPGHLSALGDGIAPLTLYLNYDAYEARLAQLVVDVSSVGVTLKYNSSLVPRNIPFQLQLIDHPEPNKTTAGALHLGAAATDVDSALETLLSVIGPDSVSVLLTRTESPGPGGTKNIEDFYSITPQNAFAQQATPDFKVLTSPNPGFTHSVVRAFARGLLTQNQRAFLATKSQRETFFSQIKTEVERFYQPLGPGVILSDAAASDPRQFGFDWIAETPGHYAEFDAPAFKSVGAFLASDRSKLNRSQAAFRLGQLLSEARELSGEHQGKMYIPQLFVPEPSAKFDESQAKLVFNFSSTIAHELGHGLGGPHVAHWGSATATDEVQEIRIDAGAANFTLMLGGASATFARSTSPLGIQNTLRGLPGMAHSKLIVTGPVGGPYRLHYGNSVDFPLIQGVGITSHQITEASYHQGFTREIVIGANKGRNDLMYSEGILPALTFLPLISQSILRMSLGTNWAGSDARHAQTIYTLASSAGDLGDIKVPGSAPGEEPIQDPDEEFFVDGPALALIDSEGLLSLDEIDFGSAEVDGPGGQVATRQFTLLNFGSQDVVVRSIHVAEGYDQFFVAPFPVTTIHPGETLDVDVTFDPRFTGPASGALSIDSDAEDSDWRFELTGAGQRTTAELRDDLLNNNFGGSAVGQFLERPSSGAILTNYGVLPVTITDVRMAAGPGDNEFLVGAFPYPVTLQPGESHEVLMQFRPSAAGFRRGVLEILSDDQHSPLIRKPLVGTGLVEGNLDYGNDFVALESVFRGLFDNTPVLRTRSDAGGNWEFFIGPERLVHIATFDPVSGLIAHGYATTNPSGQRTEFNIGAFLQSVEPDTDGDGLPDDVEFAVGTSVDSLDTDGDGVSDFAEVNQGLNPLDDRPTTTGVIAALGLASPASANDITLVADTQDTSRVTAFLATGNGLAIADVTQFDRPLLLGELTLPGSSFDVEVDPQRQIAAVASGPGGLHLLNVSDPARPVLLQTIPINASRVALFDGLAYVAVGNEIQSFDVFSGEPVETLSLGDGDVLGLRREGSLLFAINAFATECKIHAIDLAGLGMVARGSLSLPRQGEDMFVADGVAWIAVNEGTFGLMTVDVSQPDNLRLLSDTDRNTRLVQGIALNGSGLGVVAGRVFGAAVGTAIVVTTDDPTVTAPTFTQLSLPQVGQAVALSSGLAYIADGSAGLQVLNFLAFDQGTTPPVVTLGGLDTDLDPIKLGIQMLETSTLTLPARITDDVQVRSVELLVDGVRVSIDVSYPYDLTTTLPTILQTGNEAVLQIRATDTGGNVRLSDPVVIELLADLIPPTIVTLDPPDGSTQAISRRRVTIRFSEPLDPLAAAASNFELLGPGGVVAPLSMQARQSNTLLELYYPPLSEGDYQLVIDAPAVTDRVGNALGAGDRVSSFRVASIVREATIQWINPAGGFWDDAANWDDGRLPGLDDDVLIDMPGDPAITFRQGDVQIRTLVSENPFNITGGRLFVSETIQVNDTFTLRGPNAGTVGNIINTPTLSGVVLRGSGGQGLTIGGYARLEAATIQTDMTITEPGTKFLIKGGLALFGTATLGPSSGVAIGFEGSQQVTSGTFVFSAPPGAFGPSLEALGVATVTFGRDVVVRGNGVIGQQSFVGQQFSISDHRLHLINHGKISADVSGGFIITRAESLTNHGIIEAKSGGALAVDDKTWTNTVTGRISASDARFPNSTSQLELGSVNVTSWSNAGTIELTNTFAWFMRGFSNQVWSNTGTILVQNSNVQFNGRFTSADVENVRQSDNGLRFITIRGTMDNTGRTFTFTAETGSYHLTDGGRIVGGTLNMTGPNSRLGIGSSGSGGGFLDGVTINGDIVGGGVRIVNGLTVNGSVTTYDSNHIMHFEGAPQTVSGAVFRNPAFQSAIGSGPVTLDASVTIHSSQLAPGTDRSKSGSLFGNFINYAPITVDQDTGIIVAGTLAGPFINRGLVRVNPGNAVIPGGAFSLVGNSVNEGTILADRATVRLGGQGWRNSGVIEASQTQIEFGQGIPLNRIQTSDLGTIRNPGGTITLGNDMVLDNTGSTLVIDATLGNEWIVGSPFIGGATVLGGTIQVAPSARFVGNGGILQDITVQGNLELGTNGITVAGEVTFNGVINARSAFIPSLKLGFDRLFPNRPVVIHAGTLDFGGPRSKTIASFSTTTTDITFGPNVVLRGRNVTATFVQPLLNQGAIIADLVPEFPGDTGQNTITFTSAPVTNAGLLEAKGGGLLTINNLVTNRGTLKAGAGSVVSIGGNLPQEAVGIVAVEIAGPTTSQFGQVTVGGTANLAGTLNVQFTGGFAPTAGNTFQVMTYAAVSGTFGTVNVAGLPAGLVAVPVYNATNLTLVVGAALTVADYQRSTGNTVSLDPILLPAVVQEAIARWFQAGLYPELVERLVNVQWHVADLPGNTLGMAANDAVWLDADAAGNGWFVDDSPRSDEEFQWLDEALHARQRNAADGRIDLLTAVMHELGHLVGLEHHLAEDDVSTLMSETLRPGARKLPASSK